MKRVFTGVLSLALGTALLVPAATAQQQDPRKGAKKIDATELLRRKKEAYKDAEKAREKYGAWSANIKWSLSDPFQDRTSYAAGSVKVLKTDDGRLLWWAVKESSDAAGRNTMNASRTLYVGGKLRETYEPKRGTNTVTEYNAAALRYYLTQMLVRDGFNSDLERIFDVEIVANARYMKTEPNDDDWTALGFSGKEAYETWWKNKKAIVAGEETGLNEDRPFSTKEDKFDRENPRNKPVVAGGDKWGKYYIVVLRPKIPTIQRRIRSIRMTLRPGDFLPINLIFEHSTDRYRNVKFAGIRKDPEPAITKKQFTLETAGYRVVKR